MADKTQSKGTSSTELPPNPLGQLQEAGLGNLAGMGNAWLEAMGDIGAEVLSFMAERIKEDVNTQHKIMHCKNVSDLQHIQAQFIQNAINQYQAETGKLIEMSTAAMSPNDTGKKG